MIVAPHKEFNFIYSIITSFELSFNKNISVREFIYLINKLNKKFNIFDKKEFCEGEVIAMLYSDISISFLPDKNDWLNSKLKLNTPIFVNDLEKIKENIKECMKDANNSE